MSRDQERDASAEQGLREIHIFDLDHTLAKGDTFYSFLLSLLRHWPLLLWQLPILAVVMVLFKLGFISNQQAKERFLQRLLGHIPSGRLQLCCAHFVAQTLRCALQPSVVAHLKTVQQRGALTALATASPDLYVQPLAAALKFDVVICTQLARDESGQPSGSLQGDNCYGEEKRRRVEAWLSEQPESRRVWFYSDHHTDLPLLQAVDCGVMVNPNAKLRRAGQALGLQELEI